MFAFADSCAGRNPTGVTDKSKDFALGIHLPDQLQDIRIPAQLVRGPTARHQQNLQLVGGHLFGGNLTFGGQSAAFACIGFTALGGNHLDFCTLFSDLLQTGAFVPINFIHNYFAQMFVLLSAGRCQEMNV
jgi:hypothetical protein